MIEVWKDIEGYEGYYQVSTHGRVKSVRYGRILKPGRSGSGWLVVALSKKGKPKTKSVKTLIYNAFKDNNRLEEINNCAENSFVKTNKQLKPINQKPIKAIYEDGTYEIFDSATIYAKERGILPSTIVNVLKGRLKSHKGVKFEYLEVE